MPHVGEATPQQGRHGRRRQCQNARFARKQPHAAGLGQDIGLFRWARFYRRKVWADAVHGALFRGRWHLHGLRWARNIGRRLCATLVSSPARRASTRRPSTSGMARSNGGDLVRAVLHLASGLPPRHSPLAATSWERSERRTLGGIGPAAEGADLG